MGIPGVAVIFLFLFLLLALTFFAFVFLNFWRLIQAARMYAVRRVVQPRTRPDCWGFTCLGSVAQLAAEPPMHIPMSWGFQVGRSLRGTLPARVRTRGSRYDISEIDT